MDKRTLKREYKETEIPMGVYRIWNKRSDRSLVGSSLNLPAILNRSRSELRLGGHRNRELQSDWSSFGEDAFELEILDTLPPRDEPGYDARRELKVLEDLWLERLQPYGSAATTRPRKSRRPRRAAAGPGAAASGGTFTRSAPSKRHEMDLDPQNCWDCPLTLGEFLGILAICLAVAFAGPWLLRRRAVALQALGAVVLLLTSLLVVLQPVQFPDWGVLRWGSGTDVYPRPAVRFACLAFAGIFFLVSLFAYRRFGRSGRTPVRSR